MHDDDDDYTPGLSSGDLKYLCNLDLLSIILSFFDLPILAEQSDILSNLLVDSSVGGRECLDNELSSLGSQWETGYPGKC